MAITMENLLDAMIDEINEAPKSVNGITPDENGNIEIDNNYTYGTEPLEAGVTPLETGKIHFIYE